MHSRESLDSQQMCAEGPQGPPFHVLVASKGPTDVAGKETGLCPIAEHCVHKTGMYLELGASSNLSLCRIKC